MGTATWNTRRIHVIYVDVENSTWNIRLFYVENGHQVDRYFSMSNPRRFNVKIYPAIGKVDFLRRIDVILRRKVSVRIWYIFQRRFNVEISLSPRTVDSSTSNIRRFHVDASPTVFVDFSTLNARRFSYF